MQLESLFTDQKWNILKQLAHEPQSPLQLSHKLNTTMANVSQQLKLLEAVNLVKKEKIRNRDKGKPRTLFSLTADYALLVPLTKNFAEKKLVKATDHQKSILRIWFLQSEALQHETEMLYWKLHGHFKDIEAIVVDENSGTIHVVSENKEARAEAQRSKSAQAASPKDFLSALHKIASHKLALIHGSSDILKGDSK
jgi:predicted transcriptional regulator